MILSEKWMMDFEMALKLKGTRRWTRCDVTESTQTGRANKKHLLPANNVCSPVRLVPSDGSVP